MKPIALTPARLSPRERNAVANFLSSLDGLEMHDAYENARADARSYRWSDAALTAVIDGIGDHFIARKRLAEVFPPKCTACSGDGACPGCDRTIPHACHLCGYP